MTTWYNWYLCHLENGDYQGYASSNLVMRHFFLLDIYESDDGNVDFDKSKLPCVVIDNYEK